MSATALSAPAHGEAAAARPAAGDAIISVRELTKTFPVRRSWSEILSRPWRRAARTVAVDRVSFDVAPTELFGLLGANGAGKTTLFRMLSTLLLPDGGTARIAGRDVVRDARAVRSLLSLVVPDERSLDWRLTARENLELFAALHRVPRRQVAERLDELLEVVGLQDTGTKMVGTFSSGMKQRLLIARALLPRPSVLLLDEPTRSLDPVSARQFRQFLRHEIAGRQQCTILLATHNAEEAFELCDRVAVLDRGRLLAVGRLDELMGEVRDDIYRLAVRTDHVGSAIRALVRAGHGEARLIDGRGTADWTVLELAIPGGPDAVAAVVDCLAHANVHISAVEHRPITLADLLERMVRLKAGS
jgi:ABC-2 type transport system ATP-binding protein